MSEFELRRVNEGDCQFLFELANDATVRATAINKEPIEWESHVRWFTNRLQSPQTYMYVLIYDMVPVGQVRYELKDGAWDIGYSIAPAHRGKGLGRLIIEQSLKLMPAVPIVAVVKPDNIASLKVFRSLQFRETDTIVINGESYVKFDYKTTL